MSRLRTLGLLGAIAVVTMLAGCLDSAWAADTPRYGGTLIKTLGANPPMFNSAITADHMTVSAGCLLYNGLIYLDRDGNPKPELAKSWEVKRGGLEFVFTLQPNAKWHDGKPFTSADVKFTMEEMLAKYHPRAKAALADVTAVEIPDPRMVVIKFSKVFAPFLQVMSCAEAPILPKHLYEGTDVLKNPHNTDNPVGTGAFKLTEFVRGDHLTFVRNPDFFLPGRPYLDRLVLKIIPDAAGRLLAFEKGELDYIETSYFPLPETGAQPAEKQGWLPVEARHNCPGRELPHVQYRARACEGQAGPSGPHDGYRPEARAGARSVRAGQCRPKPHRLAFPVGVRSGGRL